MSRAVPLAIALVPGGPRPIVRQIADQIRLAITTGELEHGERLPSVRALASQLLVNSNTVARAYSDLANEGWLQGQHGQGMFVAGLQGRLSQTERKRRLDEAVAVFVATIVEIDLQPSIALAAVTTALQDLDTRRVA
jgi:GntR family transcriptional regulator